MKFCLFSKYSYSINSCRIVVSNLKYSLSTLFIFFSITRPGFPHSNSFTKCLKRYVIHAKNLYTTLQNILHSTIDVEMFYHRSRDTDYCSFSLYTHQNLPVLFLPSVKFSTSNGQSIDFSFQQSHVVQGANARSWAYRCHPRSRQG